MQVNRFKTELAQTIFRNKYAQGPNDTWDALAERLVEDVCGSRWGSERPIMSDSDRKELTEHIKTMRFLPGGRYLYYAGRPYKAYNNCYLLRAEEDTREEWSAVTWRAMSCLMTGGGIGIDYSILRPEGKVLARTGGTASGPIPLMYAINEIGRNVMQGGSRRSAIYASLNWKHEDIPKFLVAKNWTDEVKRLKEQDFNFPAPLDMTNISVNYDDAALGNPNLYPLAEGNLAENPVFKENVRQALMTGEPGFSFNFGDNSAIVLAILSLVLKTALKYVQGK
jgi:ribonucleoside-diphosphate reductase alpha chain